MNSMMLRKKMHRFLLLIVSVLLSQVNAAEPPHDPATYQKRTASSSSSSTGDQHTSSKIRKIATTWEEFAKIYEPGMVATSDDISKILRLYDGKELVAEISHKFDDLENIFVTDNGLVLNGPGMSFVFQPQADGRWQEHKVENFYKTPIVKELKDGRIAVSGQSQGQGKIFIQQIDGSFKEQKIEGIEKIYTVQELKDGRLLIMGISQRHSKTLIQQADYRWQEFKLKELPKIDRVQELNDGRLVVMGESQSQKKVFIQQADGSWQDQKIIGDYRINSVQELKDGRLVVSGKSYNYGNNLIYLIDRKMQLENIEGLYDISSVQELKDGRLLVMGESRQGQRKIFIEQRGDGFKELEIKGLDHISYVQELKDGRLLVKGGGVFAGQPKIFIQQADGRWQEQHIEELYYTYTFQELKDGRLLIMGESLKGQRKIFTQQADGRWQEFKLKDLRQIDRVQELKDGRLLVGGSSQGQPKIFIQESDGSWQQLLGSRIIQISGWSLSPLLQKVVEQITKNHQLNLDPLKELCGKIAGPSKPHQALSFFTILNEAFAKHFKLGTNTSTLDHDFDGSSSQSSSSSSSLPSPKPYKTQEQLDIEQDDLVETLAELRQIYRQTWLSPYLDALYFEQVGMRDLAYQNQPGFSVLTLKKLKKDAADLVDHDPMHFKNRLAVTQEAHSILKNIRTNAPELIKENDFEELLKNIRLALHQLKLLSWHDYIEDQLALVQQACIGKNWSQLDNTKQAELRTILWRARTATTLGLALDRASGAMATGDHAFQQDYGAPTPEQIRLLQKLLEREAELWIEDHPNLAPGTQLYSGRQAYGNFIAQQPNAFNPAQDAIYHLALYKMVTEKLINQAQRIERAGNDQAGPTTGSAANPSSSSSSSGSVTAPHGTTASASSLPIAHESNSRSAASSRSSSAVPHQNVGSHGSVEASSSSSSGSATAPHGATGHQGTLAASHQGSSANQEGTDQTETPTAKAQRLRAMAQQLRQTARDQIQAALQGTYLRYADLEANADVIMRVK